MAFKGKNYFFLDYDKYQKMHKKYKSMGGPKKILSNNDLQDKIMKTMLLHLNKIEGETLYDQVTNYLSFFKKITKSCEINIIDEDKNEVEFSKKKMVNEFETNKSITLFVLLGFYYDIMNINNFAMIHILDRIFRLYDASMQEYEIDEIDDCGYVKITFIKK